MCNPTDENHYLKKKQQNIVTVILRCQKICQLGKLWQQSNAKTVYRTLKSHKKDVVRFQAYPELDCLNKHFATSESRLPSNLPMKNLTFNMSAKEYYMVIFPKDELEIGKIISNLKHTKSHGHDGISNEILRCCSPLVEPYPAVAFNINFRKILKLQKVFRFSKKTIELNWKNTAGLVFGVPLAKFLKTFCINKGLVSVKSVVYIYTV